MVRSAGLLEIGAAEKIGKMVELSRSKTFGAGEPCGDVAERRGVEAAMVNPASLAATQEARTLQDAQVLGNGGQGNGERRGEF